MNKAISLSVLAVAAFGAAASAQVTNGGFETGDLTGWSTGGNFGFTGVSSNLVNSGSFSFQMGPVGSTGFIEQVLALGAGTQVVLDFWLASNGDPFQTFSATLDGQNVYSTANSGAFGYTHISIPVTINNNNPVLHFEFQDDPAWYFLDDVSVSVVPAPGAAAALGLVGLGALRRRR